ncbi:MAG: WYL domain-containing transcriptional regulator [Lachnospiraceae bacterium]|nr:WYL domain-containing transcriptional regulator [Lachnospiraceae bacterium]
MASGDRKQALLIMMRELLAKTDEEHSLNATELGKILESEGCPVDRRTIYANIEALENFGLDIIKKEGSTGGYYIGSREFELPELKLLVDAVQASRFITEKKSAELIRKLGRLINEQRARDLNRTVFIRGRMKTENERIYYNVDAIHEAMNHDQQISFQYAEWTPKKRLVVKKGGARYQVSPWALTWDDENYYLIAFDEGAGIIKHFRVDKIMKLKDSEERRNGQQHFRNFDLAKYAKKTFGMYGGKDECVTLRCDNHLAGVVIDRFGSGVMMIPEGEEHFHVTVEVAVSRQFYGWVTSIGSGMEITGPAEVREGYKAYLSEILGHYS